MEGEAAYKVAKKRRTRRGWIQGEERRPLLMYLLMPLLSVQLVESTPTATLDPPLINSLPSPVIQPNFENISCSQLNANIYRNEKGRKIRLPTRTDQSFSYSIWVLVVKDTLVDYEF